MNAKRIIIKLYSVYLQQKWKMTHKGAYMLSCLFYDDYKNYLFWKAFQTHKHGYTVPDWNFLGLTKENCKTYMSNAVYCGMHPINGRFSAWIDDKLTLKYLFAGTELDKYMPKYYFQIDAKGRILPLMDYPVALDSADSAHVADLLIMQGELAIKLVAGSIGEGFYKAEYKGDAYYLNGIKMMRDEFCHQIGSLRDYLVIEFLHPHDEFTKYCSGTVNCIRYLIGRIDGKMERLCSFIRFGTKESGFVENYNAGGVLCYIDEEGKFTSGNMIDRANGNNRTILQHPDTQEKLVGQIPHWDEIVRIGRLLDKHFPQLDYLGIDFVVTSQNTVKILEINSLSSLDALQLDDSILEKDIGVFYRNRMR